MAVGGPMSAQDERNQVVSVAPLKFKTEIEARADTAWWTVPSGSTTPYALDGKFS